MRTREWIPVIEKRLLWLKLLSEGKFKEASLTGEQRDCGWCVMINNRCQKCPADNCMDWALTLSRRTLACNHRGNNPEESAAAKAHRTNLKRVVNKWLKSRGTKVRMK